MVIVKGRLIFGHGHYCFFCIFHRQWSLTASPSALPSAPTCSCFLSTGLQPLPGFPANGQKPTFSSQCLIWSFEPWNIEPRPRDSEKSSLNICNSFWLLLCGLSSPGHQEVVENGGQILPSYFWTLLLLKFCWHAATDTSLHAQEQRYVLIYVCCVLGRGVSRNGEMITVDEKQPASTLCHEPLWHHHYHAIQPILIKLREIYRMHTCVHVCAYAHIHACIQKNLVDCFLSKYLVVQKRDRKIK